ncbi:MULTISPECIES: K(+)-transporting ATPase subunit F [Bacillaceae]
MITFIFVLALGVVIYLLYALLNPEKF